MFFNWWCFLFFGTFLEFTPDAARNGLARLCLWSVIERMKLYKFLPLILTTFSFTLYYFYPLFWGPHPYKAFIYFQTMMYLIMGLWWGYAFLRERNITHVFLMHIFFQIGYYTADIWKFIGEL